MHRNNHDLAKNGDNVTASGTTPRVRHLEDNHNVTESSYKDSESTQLLHGHVFPDIQVLHPTPGSYGSMLSTSTAGTAATVYHSLDANTCSLASSPGQYLEVGSGPRGVIHTPVDNFAETLEPKPNRNEAQQAQGTAPMRPCIHRTSTPIIMSYVPPAPPTDRPQEIPEGDGSKVKRAGLASYTRAQWSALAAVCYVNFASNASFSILSAFFGKEAVDHGASDLEIGLIFGSYAIVNSIFCPLYGYLIPLFGPKPLLLFGMLLSSACSFLFSQIRLIVNPKIFVFACLTCRSIQAMGCAAYFIGSVVIVAQEWRESMTFAMGIGEVFTGVGMISGPLLGGWLYEQGGFQLPFLVVGLIMFVGLFVSYYSLLNEQGTSAPSGNFLTLIKIPNVTATLILMCVMWAAMDFNMPILAMHMEVLNASPVVVGAMFLIMASAYSLCAPVIGILAKSKKSERISMILGGLLVAASFLLIGPSPLFDLVGFSDITLTSVALSMSLLGIGLSAALVPTFNDLSNSAVEGGMADDMVTAGLVGGIFNGGTFFGEFIGPTVEGALMNNFHDYRMVSSLFSAFIFFMVMSVMLFYTLERRFTRRALKRDEPPCLDTVQRLYDTSDESQTQRLLE